MYRVVHPKPKCSNCGRPVIRQRVDSQRYCFACWTRMKGERTAAQARAARKGAEREGRSYSSPIDGSLTYRCESPFCQTAHRSADAAARSPAAARRTDSPSGRFPASEERV